MQTFDYRLYADKIHCWRCINTLEGTFVSQNMESNIQGGIYSIERVYKDENG